MPVLFVGHGSPMNAIEDTPFSVAWNILGPHLPRHTAILCISAHWLTDGDTRVRVTESPETIYDFSRHTDLSFIHTSHIFHNRFIDRSSFSSTLPFMNNHQERTRYDTA